MLLGARLERLGQPERDARDALVLQLGFGLDRLATSKHGIDDIRDLFTNDIRFLEQF